MALEDKLESVVKALQAHGAIMEKAIAAGVVGGGSSAKPGPGRPAGSTNKPKVTVEQLEAKTQEVKVQRGAPVVKELIRAHGGGALADLKAKPDAWPAYMAACDAALAPADEPVPDDDEEL